MHMSQTDPMNVFVCVCESERERVLLLENIKLDGFYKDC